MTRLHDCSICMVPKRVLLLSVLVTGLLVGGAFMMGWPLIQLLGGFWLGVVVGLISFRLMVMAAEKLLDRSKNGLSAQIGLGFFGRFGLYIICFFVTAQIGLYALLACAFGLSMVGVVLKLNGFFTAGVDVGKKE